MKRHLTRWWPAYALALFVALPALWYLSQNPSAIPTGRNAKLFAVSFIVAGAFASPWILITVNALYTPDEYMLFAYDFREGFNGFYLIGATEWRNIDVDGELYQIADGFYHCLNFDKPKMEAEGTWLGESSDVEYLAAREAIKENRSSLQEIARKGLVIRARQSSQIHTALNDIMMQFLADFEAETLYKGEKIQERIENAVENVAESEASKDAVDDQGDAYETLRVDLDSAANEEVDHGD